mmetsp:Transcript_60594/g.69154  ORF Transcript_60594/g.69154 Transcript_60594/m.69154 type:complete len:311 (+) Transcript_60594:1-933(+)
MGGGTGSGFGSLILSKMRIYDCIVQSFCVFPSSKQSEVVVEPYNATFGINYLIEYSTLTHMIENDALYNICQLTQRHHEKRDYSNVNSIVSSFMSTVSAPTRFSGSINSNIRKMSVNLVPFPRHHFMLNSLAPLNLHFDPTSSSKPIPTPALVEQLFNKRNFLTDTDISNGRHMSAFAIFRGNDLSNHEIENELYTMTDKQNSRFVEWIPNNIATSISRAPTKSLSTFPLKSAAYISNHTECRAVFQKISERFTTMFRRRAYCHWYTATGMDEMEFVEAESNLNDMCTEYCEWPGGTWSDEEFYDEDDYE